MVKTIMEVPAGWCLLQWSVVVGERTLLQTIAYPWEAGAPDEPADFTDFMLFNKDGSRNFAGERVVAESKSLYWQMFDHIHAEHARWSEAAHYAKLEHAREEL